MGDCRNFSLKELKNTTLMLFIVDKNSLGSVMGTIKIREELIDENEILYADMPGSHGRTQRLWWK